MGRCSQEQQQQQQHGELEDSVDIRWSGAWSGCLHQKRYLSKRLFVSLVVYSTHAATDTSATKDESWVENGDGHETYQTSVPVMDDLRA